jgi:hypothetical protein
MGVVNPIVHRRMIEDEGSVDEARQAWSQMSADIAARRSA